MDKMDKMDKMDVVIKPVNEEATENEDEQKIFNTRLRLALCTVLGTSDLSMNQEKH